MANYACYCLYNFGITPSRFMEMSQREKAFIIAAVDLRLGKK